MVIGFLYNTQHSARRKKHLHIARSSLYDVIPKKEVKRDERSRAFRIANEIHEVSILYVFLFSFSVRWWATHTQIEVDDRAPRNIRLGFRVARHPNISIPLTGRSVDQSSLAKK